MPADAWPRTRRPLPWLLAGFLAAIFLMPIDAIHPKVSLPFSSDLDRFLVALIVAAWAAGGAARQATGRRHGLRSRGWAAGMIAFLLVAVASIAVNVDRITNLGEWEVAQKRLAVLVALAALFAIVSLTLRVAELRPFVALIVVLATITALGTIYEKRTGDNVFYETVGEGPLAGRQRRPLPDRNRPRREPRPADDHRARPGTGSRSPRSSAWRCRLPSCWRRSRPARAGACSGWPPPASSSPARWSPSANREP